MNVMRICSVCSKPLAANAPQGLCLECLLKAGLGTGVDIGPDSQSQVESGKLPFVTPTPEELAKLFPQLEILSFIGQGGMGAVYKAKQKALDRVVALKILPPGIGGDPSFAQRFAREAKALAKLNHPGIVTLYEFGQADGLFFFLMEFVDGMNLRHLLEVERISPREALAIVPQICDALQCAHDQGIVHRDIKPENILLDRQSRVKVADFGLAKLVGAGEEPSAIAGVAAGSVVLTEVGKVMGTPQYMAPEQREHPAGVDHRVDIYSLGVVLYQMLTGELPGKRIEPPSHRVQVDVRIDEIVLRALERTPELRYQTAADFRTQIETVVNDTGTATPANRTDNSAPRRLNVGTSLVTTPEQLGTFEGQFFLYRRKSQMFLEDRQLTFARGGTTTVIPLAAIRDLSIGHYPRTMHPAGLDFISVTYDEGGQTKRLFFSPYESWFGLPSHFNQFVAEWFAAIRAAVVAATGREPRNTPAEQLGVPSGSKAIYAMYALMLGPAFVLAGVVMGVYQFVEGHVATHSLLGGWVIILGVLAVGLLALTFGRLFGRGPKPAMPTPPGETGPAATRGRLRAALIVGVLVWLFVTGTVTLIMRIQAESWKVVAVISCPLKSQPGRPVEDHFKHTATMIELTRSDFILGRVIDRLQLDERSGKLDERWGKRNIGLKLTKAQAMVLLKRRLDVRSEGGTLIQVGVFGKRPEEPEEAMDIANTIAEELRAFRIEQHDSPADMLEMTLRFTPPDILLGLAAGFVLGLLAGGLVLWRGFLRRGSQATAVPLPGNPPRPRTLWRWVAATGALVVLGLGVFNAGLLVRSNRMQAAKAAQYEEEQRQLNEARKPQPKTTPAKAKRVHHFPTGAGVKTIAYSTDGKLVAIANGNLTFIGSRVKDNWKPLTEILDAETGKTVVSLKLTTKDEDTVLAATERVPDFEVTALVFAPDGNVVAVGTTVGQVKLFNARTGELVRSLEDEQAKLADKKTPEKLKSLTRAIGSVTSLAFSPDGSLLAMSGSSFDDFPLVRESVERAREFGTGPGRLKVWEVKTGTLKYDLVGHSHANAVSFSPDGNLLASAGRWEDAREHGTGLIIWNPHTGTTIRTIPTDANGGAWSVAFSPNSKLVVISSRTFDKDNDTSTSAVSLLHAGTGIMEWQHTVSGWGQPAVFAPDGKSVAVLCDGRSIRFLETESGKVKHEIRSADSPQGGRWNGFAITPQGHMLAIGGVDNERKGSVELWDFDGLGTAANSDPVKDGEN